MSAATIETVAVVKRRVNYTLRDGLGSSDAAERIAFFCECVRADRYKAVWLTGRHYDRARATPEWLALIDEHRAADGLA